MKKINIKLAALLSAALMIGACTNLDENLRDQWTTSNFLKNKGELDAALQAPYSTLFGFYGHNGYFTLQEVTTDEAMIPQRGGDWYDGGQPAGMHTHAYGSNYDAVNNLWNAAYGGISACNRLIVTPGIDTDAAAQAELKALRAFFYWVAMDNFGNVPLSTKLGETEGQKDRATMYAFIESELTASLANLPKTGNNYGRMTYYAAQALLAKLYLNAKVYTGTAQNAKVIAACDAIINDGKYSLEGNYFDVFKSTNAGSKEHIWAVPYDFKYGQGFNLVQMTLHYGSQDTYKLQQQPWNGYCSLEDFYNSYDPADKRRKNNFVAGPQFKLDGVTPVTDASFEANDPDGINLNFTPHVNELAPNALRQAGARLGKYEFAIGATPNLDNDFPIFRYADVLMMKAEALFNTNGYGDAAGQALVAQVQARTGVTLAPANADEFLAERGREFAFEAWRRNDLIRFGKYGQAWFGKGVDADNHREIFPIPIQQITATAGSAHPLVQNPGYN